MSSLVVECAGAGIGAVECTQQERLSIAVRRLVRKQEDLEQILVPST